MLKQRILAAAVMTTVLGLALWADVAFIRDSLMLHLIFIGGAFFSFREFWPLCRMAGHQTFSIWGTLTGCALIACHYVSMWLLTETGLPGEFRGTESAILLGTNITMGALAMAVLGAFLLTARRNKFEASIGGVGVTCLGLLYIAFLPSFLLRLRHMNPDGGIGGPVESWNVFGHHLVLATIILSKGCDAWAYLIGRHIGRRKAFPILSPGKTIEGVAAGLIGSVLTALFLHWNVIGVLSHFSVAECCIIGFLIGLAGIMGDLTESLLKRSAGAKDAGQVIPGYGGAMDVVDSLMVAAPVAYFLFSAIISIRRL